MAYPQVAAKQFTTWINNMAHSIQSIGENSEIVSDSDLEILVAIMLEEIYSSNDKYSLLEGYATQFKDSVLYSGPGCIDLELDTLVSNLSAKTQFLELLSALEVKVSNWDEYISDSVVGSKQRMPRLRFSDYPRARIIVSINKIFKLANV